MLHKIQPIPRAILILAVVGGLGYAALRTNILGKPNEPPVAAAVPDVVVKPFTAIGGPAAAVADIVQSQNVAQPVVSGLTAAPTSNKGLDAVLGAGNRK